MKTLIPKSRLKYSAKQHILVLLFSALPTTVMAIDCTTPHWVSAWQASPSDAALSLLTPADYINVGSYQTFREIFSPLGQGTSLRLKISNRFGIRPLVIQTVTLAKQSSGAAIIPASLTSVRFNGSQAVVIPAGTDRFSDPVSFNFTSFDKLAASIAVTDIGGLPTAHHDGRELSYATKVFAGDYANDLDDTAFVQKTNRRHLLIGMDVLASSATSTIVALGDSITDGASSKQSENKRYPDALKRRLEAAGMSIFVSNAGIGGNRVASGPIVPQVGPSALNRLSEDVLLQSGVRDVILLEGINDIALDPFKFIDSNVLFQVIINAYTSLISRMHSQGIRVTQGTLTPTGKTLAPTLTSKAATDLRNRINNWIRTSSPADNIADFDKVLRDPDPKYINNLAAVYDSGDGIHPNDDGYARMAQEVDLTRLQGAACR